MPHHSWQVENPKAREVQAETHRNREEKDEDGGGGGQNHQGGVRGHPRKGGHEGAGLGQREGRGSASILRNCVSGTVQILHFVVALASTSVGQGLDS